MKKFNLSIIILAFITFFYQSAYSMDMVFVDEYSTPWVLSSDGKAKRSYYDEKREIGNFNKIDKNVYMLQFSSTPDYKYDPYYDYFLIVGDTIYEIQRLQSVESERMPIIDECVYDSVNNTLKLTKINGSSDVNSYVTKIFDPEIYGNLDSNAIPLEKLEKIASRWKTHSRADDVDNQIIGSFKFKGRKFMLLKSGNVIIKDRSLNGNYVKMDGGKSYQIYTWYPFFEGSESFLVVDNNVYSIDVGCCSCVYNYTYDWENKIVIKKGGCDDEVSVEKIPLSKMKPVSTITWIN